MGDVRRQKCKPRTEFVKGFKAPGGFGAPIGDVSMRSNDDGEEEEEKKGTQFCPSETPGGEPDQNIITVSVRRLQKPHEYHFSSMDRRCCTSTDG